MQIVNRQTAGSLFIIGLFLILALNLILSQPILLSISLIMALFLIIIFLYNPKWGFFLILFARPLIDKLNLSLTLDQNFSLNIQAAFGLLTIVLFSIFIFLQKDILKKMPLKYSWLLFIAVIVFSLFFSIDIAASFYEIIRIFSIFLFFVSAFIFAKKEKSFNFILWAIISSAGIPFLIAIYQLSTGTGLVDSSGLDSRIYATFSHANSFASFCLIILATTIYFLLNKKKKMKIFIFILSFLALFLLIMTYSRGAWLALLIFSLVFVLTKFPKFIWIFIFPFIFFMISPLIKERAQDAYQSPITSSITWRLQQWERAYEIFSDRPLVGQGIGTELIAHEKYFGFYAGNQYTHNDFLRVALETGIFGFLIYFILILTTIIYLYKNYKKSSTEENKNFNLIILALFLAITSFSLSSNILRETVTQWYIWSLIGVSLALNHNFKNKNKF